MGQQNISDVELPWRIEGGNWVVPPLALFLPYFPLRRYMVAWVTKFALWPPPLGGRRYSTAELGLTGYVMLMKDIPGRRGGEVILYIKHSGLRNKIRKGSRLQ